MNKTTTDLSKHTIVVLVVAFVGIVLRFWNPAELSFINDELSTWQKISFDTVGEVIQNIKVDDSHPVGIYVFLYYWTGIFGTAQWAIKLPFALMAAASLGLIYSIGKHWFNRNVALLVLAYFATLQYPIWWAAIARQYQSGLFCGLLMVWFWTQIVVLKQQSKGYWIGFVLAGAAAMYNHYFSFIFAGAVGISGLWWVRKEQLLPYIGAGVAMVLLFLPHWGITAYQLTNADGHTWYQAPDSSFLTNHIAYIFHYSSICLGAALLIGLGAIFFYRKETLTKDWKKRLTALWLFLFPLLFGYFYSVYQSPILRTSHLLFSFPYLLLFFFSFYGKQMPNNAKFVLVSLVLFINIYTLVFGRKHYQTINSHPYKPFVANTKAFLEENPIEKTHIILGENPLYLQYYKDALQASFEHVESFRPVLSLTNFKKIIADTTKDYLIVGSLPPTYIAIGMGYYPYLVQYEEGINFEYYILSKKPVADKVNYTYSSTLTFNDEQERPAWYVDKNRVGIDTTTINFYYNIPAGEEWGASFSSPTTAVISQKNVFLELSMQLKTDSLPANGKIVFEIKDEAGDFVAWEGIPIIEQITGSPQKWQTVYASVRMAHLIDNYGILKNTTLKAFYWNEKKQKVAVDKMQIRVRKGNTILYKDTNPF